MKLFSLIQKKTYEHEKITKNEKLSINDLIMRFQENSDLLMNNESDSTKFLQIKITPLNEEGENNTMIQFIEVTNSI